MEELKKETGMEEFQEYTTFVVQDKDGNDVELAVVDEFEFEHKNYVAAARIENDEVNEGEVYIYKVKTTEDDFTVEKITNAIDYEKIANAYMEM